MNAPPSSYGIDWSLFFEWGLVIAVLAFFLYAAITIKNEKVSYKESAKGIILGQLQLMYPSWWAIEQVGENHFEFYRQDTRYDWTSSFEVLNNQIEIETQFDDFLSRENIILDNSYDSFEKTTRADYLIKDKKLVDKISDFLRVESVGTEKNSDRIYLDIIFINLDNKTYRFVSKSSVLNGCVEGPYFEECLKTAELRSF